jgi:hypothetical protein
MKKADVHLLERVAFDNMRDNQIGDGIEDGIDWDTAAAIGYSTPESFRRQVRAASDIGEVAMPTTTVSPVEASDSSQDPRTGRYPEGVQPLPARVTVPAAQSDVLGVLNVR